MTSDEAPDDLRLQVSNLERKIDDRLDRIEDLLAAVTTAVAQTRPAATPPPPAPSIAGARMITSPTTVPTTVPEADEASLAAVSPPPPPASSSPLPPPAPSGSLPVPPPPTGPLLPPLVRPAEPATAASTPGPDWSERNLETVLRLVGISLVLLASVFLVRTAIVRGWIGPELQLLGATVIGAALLAGAFPLVERRRPWAATLAVGGVAVLAICAAAGHSWLELYSPSAALGLVTLAAALSVLAAARLRLESVAMAATVALLVVPTWSRIVVDAPVRLIGVWLGAFAVVAAAVGLRQRWIGYKLVSTWSVALWVLGLAVSLAVTDEPRYAVEGGALVAVVGAVLWAGPLLTGRRLGEPAGTDSPGGGDRSWFDPARMAALETWAVSALPLWAWSALLAFLAVAPDTDRAGWSGLAMTAGFLALAPLAAWMATGRPPSGRRRPEGPLLAAHLLGAGALGAIVVVSWLDASTAAPILALQAVASLAAARQIGARVLWYKAIALAAAATVAVAGDLSDGLAADRFDIGRTVTTGVTVGALIVVAEAVARYRHRALAGLLRALAWIGGLGWVASAFLGAPQGHAIVSAVWALAAGGALALGVRRDEPLARNLGLATLVVVLVKLLTVDLAEVDTLWRVGLFLLVGLGLLRLGYVLPRLASRPVPTTESTAPEHGPPRPE